MTSDEDLFDRYFMPTHRAPLVALHALFTGRWVWSLDDLPFNGTC